MSKKLYVVFLFGIILVGLAAAPFAVNANHAWGNYHWARSSNPLSLQIGDNVTATWDAHLSAAVADWDASSVLSLAVAPGQARGKCRPTSGRIEVCNDFYGNNGWLGIAQIWVSGDHITQATTKVNDTYFSSAPYNTPDWRQFVMCQEVGHDFGLGHQDEAFDNPNLGSCMDYTNDPTRNDGQGNNLHPDTHDFDQLMSIYTHLDSSGGGGGCNPRSPNCTSGNNGLPGSDFDTPGEWGQLVRAEGRIAVYERDFGNANRVVTFVIWAN